MRKLTKTSDEDVVLEAVRRSGRIVLVMIQIRPAIAGDAVQLVHRLRAADLQEIKANLGEDPLIVLRRGIAQSDPCYAVVDDEDKPIALFGAVPDSCSTDLGMVWLLGSNDLVAHPFYVLRNSQEWIEKLQQR